MSQDAVSDDLAAAGAVILDTYRLFDQCAMTFNPIASAANAAYGEEQMLSQWFAGHKVSGSAWGQGGDMVGQSCAPC